MAAFFTSDNQFLFLAFLAARFYQTAPDAGCAEGADERTYDENPKLVESITTLEHCGSDGTCRVYGSTGVVDTYQVNEDESKTDCEAGKIACALLRIGSAKHNQNKDASEYNLCDEAGGNTYACLASVGACSSAKCSLRAGSNQCIEDCAADESTDNLEQHIKECILCTHAAGYPAAKGDSGIDVAAADAADSISHSYDCQSECHSSTYYRCGISTAVKTDSCAAAEKNEHHCAHHFC